MTQLKHKVSIMDKKKHISSPSKAAGSQSQHISSMTRFAVVSHNLQVFHCNSEKFKFQSSKAPVSPEDPFLTFV